MTWSSGDANARTLEDAPGQAAARHSAQIHDGAHQPGRVQDQIEQAETTTAQIGRELRPRPRHHAADDPGALTRPGSRQAHAAT